MTELILMISYIILADETTSKSHKFYVYLRIFFQLEAGQVEHHHHVDIYCAAK